MKRPVVALPARHMRRRAGSRISGLIATLALVQAAALDSSDASAHSWYPKTCCNEQDCFPATKVEKLPGGGLRIEAGHITVIVPAGYRAFPSQDNSAHVCVYRDIRGRYHARCLFMPGLG